MLGRFTVTKAMYSDASDWGLGASFETDWLVSAFNEKVDTALGGVLGHHYVMGQKGWGD